MIYGPFGFPMNNLSYGKSFGFMPMFPMNMNYRFPLLNFNMNHLQVPFYQPAFQFPNYSPSSAATTENNSELNPKQQAQMEAIQKLKYDSNDLQAKLEENNNIKDYAKFLESHKDYSVDKTINSADGGKIYLYKDKSGNAVGSVRKDKDGKIDNVSLDIADGGSISLNDSGNDGIIDSRFAMSKRYNIAQEENGKTTFNEALSAVLKGKDGYSVKTESRENGQTAEHYTYNGKAIAFVLKNKDGNIVSLYNFDSSVKDGKEHKKFYDDNNNNGIIDAGEGASRFDRDLS